jgi:hypothetical protein
MNNHNNNSNNNNKGRIISLVRKGEGETLNGLKTTGVYNSQFCSLVNFRNGGKRRGNKKGGRSNKFFASIIIPTGQTAPFPRVEILKKVNLNKVHSIVIH